MCIEFFLVLIYFFALFIINFLLFNLLKNYFKNILYFQKLKNILNFYESKKIENIVLFFLLKKIKEKDKIFSFFTPNFLSSQDILTLGNLYKFLKEIKEIKQENLYYFTLLENQFLKKDEN